MRNRDAGYVKWPFNDGMCPEYEERKELLRVSEILWNIVYAFSQTPTH